MDDREKQQILLMAHTLEQWAAGAEDAAVRLRVTEAVAAYTGLGSDRVLVLEGCREAIMREAG